MDQLGRVLIELRDRDYGNQYFVLSRTQGSIFVSYA